MWQACTLTLLALVTLEVTGLGAAAVRLCVASWGQAGHDSELPDLIFERLSADVRGTATSSRATAAGSGDCGADSYLVASLRVGHRRDRHSGTNGVGAGRYSSCSGGAASRSRTLTFGFACIPSRIEWAFGWRFER